MKKKVLLQTGKRAVSIICVILCIFYMKNQWKQYGNVWSELEKGELSDYAIKSMMPALFYSESKENGSIRSFVAGAVMTLWPIGTYTVEQVQEKTASEDTKMYRMILEKQENDENVVDEDGQLIVTENQPVQETIQETVPKATIDMEKLKDYEYLMSHFYTVDSSTMADPKLINAEKLLGKSLKITQDGSPKVLIYHTHSQEMFADSVPGDESTSIVGMGSYLSELLNQKYQIVTLHHKGVYDLVNGKLDRSKAYQLAEPQILQILKENPGIEVVIDLHRDGVADTTHLVTDVNGKQVAQIMFFNGLSRTRANGNISYLANPYLEDNLAFSLQMEIAAAQYYPGFARHIFLRAYRYNMHFKPKTLLIEAGAQTNTVDEMRNAMELLADLLHQVLS